MSSEIDVYMKQNDTHPPYTVSLQDDDGNAIDLSNINEATFHLRDKDTGKVVVEDTMNVVSAADGELEYPWSAGDLDEAGMYEAEVEVEYGTGKEETFPNTDNHIIKVTEDIA